jgi:hypothetical protein
VQSELFVATVGEALRVLKAAHGPAFRAARRDGARDRAMNAAALAPARVRPDAHVSARRPPTYRSTLSRVAAKMRRMPWRLSDWPVLKQIARRADGTGAEAKSAATRGLRARIDEKNGAPSRPRPVREFKVREKRGPGPRLEMFGG